MQNINPNLIDGKVQQVFADFFKEHQEKKLSNWDCDIMGLEDKVIVVIQNNVNCICETETPLVIRELVGKGISHFRQSGDTQEDGCNI
jgi:hypothetical protein